MGYIFPDLLFFFNRDNFENVFLYIKKIVMSMFSFKANEIRDLAIAFIVLSTAFGISTVGLDVTAIVSILPIVMVGVGLDFSCTRLDTGIGL